MLSPERYYAEIAASTASLGAVVDGADLTLRVPTCPDWTLRQLATHVGRAQRWAAQIVSLRSAEAIAFREVPGGRIPDDPAEHAGWLRAGADRLIAAVGQAEDVPVWAFGRQRPASFWARRMTHETAVHCADAQITVSGAEGQPTAPAIAADVAADGIDEWLTELAGPAAATPTRVPPGSPQASPCTCTRLTCRHGRVAGQPRPGRDHGAPGPREGHRRPPGRRVGPAPGLAAAAPARHPGVQLHGDPAVFRRWLDSAQF